MVGPIEKRSKLLGPSREVRIVHKSSSKSDRPNKLCKKVEEAIENKIVCDQLDKLMGEENSMRKLLLEKRSQKGKGDNFIT